MARSVVLHEQALKDWEQVMLAQSFDPAPFLLASIVQLSVINMTGKKEVYVDREVLEYYVPAATADKGIALMEQAGLVKVVGSRIVIGTRKGLIGVAYTAIPQGANAPTPNAPSADDVPHTRKAGLTLEELEETRALLSTHYDAYATEMKTVHRTTEGPNLVRSAIKAALDAVVGGRDMTTTELLRYFHALVAIKTVTKTMRVKYTGMEQGQSAQTIKMVSADVLVELVPYFVFIYADDSDEWHHATWSLFASNNMQQKVLAKFNNTRNKKGKKNGQKGQFI
jgi:hypothetical protein